MSTEDDGIIDAEIVEDHCLPAAQVSTSSRMDYPRWSEEWWQLASPEAQSRRCVAHKSNGNRCLKAAIKGATVCRTHGGATRHVKQAARIRLENAAELMAKQLLGIALTADTDAVKLAAIRDALDRAGLKAPSELVLSQGEAKPYETVFDSIGGDPEAAGFASSPIEDSVSAGIHSPPPAMAANPVPDNATEAEQDVSHTGATRYSDGDSASCPEGSASSADAPPRQGRPRRFDRDRPQQARELHITGDDAIRLANEANRQAGGLPPMRELESPHKGYRRP
ncbi:hypothetical protein [Mycobacterium avium]|uniref:hypothetical protein n=1 Tax=Mycobacterium avium TaxID=1764 RepID=UPI0009BF226B|nr:hypothetical protein [Mycobacterium avium]